MKSGRPKGLKVVRCACGWRVTGVGKTGTCVCGRRVVLKPKPRTRPKQAAA